MLPGSVEPQIPRTLEIAHVLFMDIVSYSLLPMDHQREIISELQDLIRATLEFQQAQVEDRLIACRPATAWRSRFFGDPCVPRGCAREIALLAKNDPRISLRMGIHTGPV